MKEQNWLEDGWFYHNHAWHLLHEIIKLIPDNCNSLLDVGAGTGIAAAVIKAVKPDIDVSVCDIESSCVEYWEKRNLNKWFLIDDDMFMDIKYDFIMASHVIEHIEEPDNIIKTMFNICNNRLVIVVPDGDVHFYDHKVIYNRSILEDTIKRSIDYDFNYVSYPVYHHHINNLVAVIDKK